mmetsp:Transcript_35560/g.88405  ORF Transcript_35560/g.88405 Transcript_35560/m.88405 type:complete len:81 (+) Transcript_35560:1247-1489(+)
MANSQTHRRIDRERDRKTDGQTDRQTDRRTGRLQSLIRRAAAPTDGWMDGCQKQTSDSSTTAGISNTSAPLGHATHLTFP